MLNFITKSDFLRYINCSAYFWFFKKKPKVLRNHELSDFDKELIKNGQAVEQWARKLFPRGVLVKCRESDAIDETKEYLEKGLKTIFQATLQVENLYVMVDVLEWDETNGYWIINEVKATSGKEKKKDQHLYDATFQFIVAEMAGYNVGKVNLIELNKDFRKQGNINVGDLMQISDITEQVKELEDEVKLKIADMKGILESDREPLPCDCLYKSRGNHCPAFKYLHPEVPDYSVHDIALIGLSLKKLEALIEADFLSIYEVPKDFKLSKYQRDHIEVTQSQNPKIDHQSIREKLNELVYPLYFLDYETYPASVPIYDGCAPYQQVPFQFSLHIMREPNGKLEHYEYLHTDIDSHPMIALANELMKVIGEDGSIVVWNDSFEGGCHERIAELMPEFAEVFHAYNHRLFDLMKIFSKNNYVHHDFRGGFSIKVVLPVLVPEMSYKDLNVRDGGMAMNAWKEMMFDTEDDVDKNQIRLDLLEYCKLDTLAMVKIFEALQLL